jgi:hypothetical protein
MLEIDPSRSGYATRSNQSNIHLAPSSTKRFPLMSTPLLPTELWRDIGSYIRRQDHCSLVVVNKHFNAVFLPVLYSHPIITGPSGSIIDKQFPETEKPSRYVLAGTPASLVLDKLEKDEIIRKSVRECTLSRFWPSSKTSLFGFGSAPMHSYEGLMTSIFILIGKLPSLRKLNLVRVQIPTTCMLYICTRPNQTLDIYDNMAGFYGTVNIEPETTFTVSTMRFHSYIFENPIVCQIAMGRSLRELHIAGGEHRGVRHFYEAHIDSGTITLPNLEVLDIGWFNALYLPFLKMTPNLRWLRLRTSLMLELGTNPLGIDAAPKLCHFTGHNSYLKVFTKGRPITTIVTRDSSGEVSRVFTGQHDNIALSELGPFFGAADDVREVVWEKCSRNKELMAYLVQHNPRVVHLTMTPSVDYARVSNFLACLTIQLG